MRPCQWSKSSLRSVDGGHADNTNDDNKSGGLIDYDELLIKVKIVIDNRHI